MKRAGRGRPGHCSARRAHACRAARYGERARWRVLFTLMLGTVSSIVSSTIVNVAIPDLSRHFAGRGARAMGGGQLHDRHDAVAAADATAAQSLRPAPHLHRLCGVARLRRAGRQAVAHLRRDDRHAGGQRGASPPASCSRCPISSSCACSRARERGKAVSLFGFGVVLAPALGPNLGGFWSRPSAGAPSSLWWCR